MTTSTPPSTEAAPVQAKPRRHWLRTVLLIVVGVLLVAFIGIQFIPVNRTNPAVTTPIKWDSPQTQALAQRACTDCHSNQTNWPWYSYVAPVSWPIYYDVVRGRGQWNLSTMGTQGQGGEGFGATQGDLAFQLGGMLIGGRGFGGGDRGGDGQRRPPNGQFPPGGGQFPPREGGFGGEGGAGRIAEQIQNGTMPPAIYTMWHPDAVLTDAEKQQLIQGLTATINAMQQQAQPSAQGN